MNSPTHMIIAAAAFAKPEQQRLTFVALLGGFIPDLSLYALFFWHRFVIGTSAREIFDTLYFSDQWQFIFAIDNSFLIWGAVLAFSLWSGNRYLIAFTGAAFLHLMCDFPLHHDDARAHFWPVTSWKFESPVSYWDENHHGGIVSVLEIMLTCVLLGILWQRFTAIWPRVMISCAAILTVIPFVAFRIIM